MYLLQAERPTRQDVRCVMCDVSQQSAGRVPARPSGQVTGAEQRDKREARHAPPAADKDKKTEAIEDPSSSINPFLPHTSMNT